MRYFLDTEFHEDGRIIDLISLALVAEDGRQLYCISSEFDPERCTDWVKANVLPHINPVLGVPRSDIRDRVLSFVGDDPKPEFWGYYADYDWVVLCQLFGRMVDLPGHFPKHCRDLKQLAGKIKLPKQTGAEHHALLDAHWIRDSFVWLTGSQGVIE